VLVVFQSTATLATDPAYSSEVADFMSRARGFPHVINVTRGPASEDGRTTLVTVNFNSSNEAVQHAQDDFRALVPTSGPAKAYITGNPAVYATFSRITQEDTASAEERALPLALFILIIVFGTVVAAVMPLLLALVAVPVALAIIYGVAQHMQTTALVTNVVSIVGLGISIDYSLFMVRRFREELARGRDVRDAVGWTVATAGEAILFSGLTVIIGFIGLLLIGLQFMTSFGIGGFAVVASAMLAALTLLPALLAVLGQLINALRAPLLWRLTLGSTHNEHGGFWRRWALGVMRHPVPIVLGVCILLLGMGWPLLSLNIGTPGASSLPPNAEARQGLDILNASFPASNENPVYIVAQTPDGSSILATANLARVDALSTWLAAQPHVTAVMSITRLPQMGTGMSFNAAQLAQIYSSGAYQSNPQLAPLGRLLSQTTSGDTTLITAKTDTKLDSVEGKQILDHLRGGDRAAGQGLMVLVGGAQAISLDFNRYLYGNFPKAIAFVLIATFLLLLLMFHSVLLPLKAVLMNVLSVSAAYGVLVVVFQWGYLSNLLDFTSDGFIDSTIPILLFCILFGLSMDYEVFLLSRIREEWLRTRNNRHAVALGLEKTGGVVTNAALLFVIVTGAFTFTSIIITKETGLGMTVAVLVDATIIRSLLVPATMRLLGRWNWWLPGRLVPSELPLK
jgi:RND superfamily putative drug exporter